jgi:hypothetical protein
MSFIHHLGTWVAILLIVAGNLGPALADDKPATRRVGLTEINHQLLVSFSFQDAFPPSIQKKLNSGLKTTVLVQLSLERQGSKSSHAYWARTVEIAYDLWEDKYLILREDDTGRRRATASSKSRAVSMAAEIINAHLVNTKDIPSGVYRIRAKIETNPVSKEMLEKIRSWLVKSQNKSSQSAAPTNYFGSFVGALVDRRIAESDHTVEFVSQWFKLDTP